MPGLTDDVTPPPQDNHDDGLGLGVKVDGKVAPAKDKVVTPDPTLEAKRAWRKDFPEDLRASERLDKFDGMVPLAKSYLELEGKLGKSVEIPGKDASPEDKARYFSRIGRPGTADEYKISVRDSELSKRLRATAFSVGVPGDMVEALSSVIANRESEQDEAVRTQYTKDAVQADKILRERFGAQYESRMQYANTAFSKLFSEGLQAKVKASGLNHDPEFVTRLADLGVELRESPLIKGANGAKDTDVDPYEKSMMPFLRK